MMVPHHTRPFTDSARGKLAEFGERVFYYVPKRLRAKLDVRFRIGVFLGDPQNPNEAFIGIENGNVIKSRCVVRVMASQRWSKDAISTIVGIPGRLTLQDVEEISPNIEEVVDPHTNKDEDIGIANDDGTDLSDDRSMKQMDRQNRITLKDCQGVWFHGWLPQMPAS